MSFFLTISIYIYIMAVKYLETKDKNIRKGARPDHCTIRSGP